MLINLADDYFPQPDFALVIKIKRFEKLGAIDGLANAKPATAGHTHIKYTSYLSSVCVVVLVLLVLLVCGM